MAKNYAAIYNSGNDSISVVNAFYLKEETTRGTLATPAASDFFFTMNGGTITYAQNVIQSEHRSDRHNTTFIKEKKTTEWSFSTYFNIDEDVAVPGTTEIDSSIRALWKSMLGREQVSSGFVYDSANAPSTTFSLFEVGDLWSKQSPAAWVDTCNAQFPGDGQAMAEWAGRAATTYLVGISVSNNDNTGGNVVTLDTAGEARRFPVGALVMIVAADGVTRIEGTDTAPRVVTARDTVAGTVTLDGATLTDMDGVAEAYLVYWEPEGAKTAVNNPVTGLVGSITLDTLSTSCVRSLAVNMNNQHEATDYCYGTDQLESPYFVPADRLLVEVSMEINLSAAVLEFYDRVQNFEPVDIDAILGDVTKRYLKIDLPNVTFSVPSIEVPDSGSIPVSFEGVAYQTALDAADEVTVSYL